MKSPSYNTSYGKNRKSRWCEWCHVSGNGYGWGYHRIRLGLGGDRCPSLILYFCMFCNFWCPNLIFGPTKRYICPLSTIRFTLLWSGLVSVTSPFPFPRTYKSPITLGARGSQGTITQEPHQFGLSLCYTLICLTTLDLEDFFSPSFFAFEKGKWKRMMLCSHRWNAKWIKKRLVHRSQVIREIDISGKRKRERC